MILISVTGACGSGKSVFSEQLARILIAAGRTCEVLNTDHYYKDFSHLSADELAQKNFCEPDCIHFDQLINDIQRLARGETIQRPCFEISKSKILPETMPIAPAEVIIVEGILVLQNPYIKRNSDINIYIDMDLDICLARRLVRDVNERNQSYEFILGTYERHIRPSFFQYTAPAKTIATLKAQTDAEKTEVIQKVVTELVPLVSEARNLLSISM